MVEAHLASTQGHRLFQARRTWGDSGVVYLGGSFASGEADDNELRDLEVYGLIRFARSDSRGDPFYEVGGEGLHFYRWLRHERGRPIDVVEEDARRLVDGDAFAARHPAVREQLATALDRLWSDRTDTQTVGALGHALVQAIWAAVDDVVGAPPDDHEKVGKRLERWCDERPAGDRRRPAVSDLVRSALSLSQRLKHLGQEETNDLPLDGWQELRQAVFLTITACYELDQAP